MDWKELFRICIGIIVYPRRTLAYIITGDFLLLGIVAWVLFCITDSVATIIHTLATQTEEESIAAVAGQVVFRPATILRTLWIFAEVYIMNAIATKIYGFGNRFVPLVSCLLFILVIPAACQPILVALLHVSGDGLTVAYAFFSLGVFFWMAFLEIRAVAMVYEAPMGTAITIWFIPIILSGTVLFLLQS